MKLTDEQKAEVEALAKAHGGRPTPEALLDRARDKNNVLHPLFEWRDKVAGHEHRLGQARAIFRVVRLDVRYETHSLATPRYVRDPDANPRQQGYVDLKHAEADADLAHRIAEQEIRRALGAIRRVQGIADQLGLSAYVNAELARAVLSLQKAKEAA